MARDRDLDHDATVTIVHSTPFGFDRPSATRELVDPGPHDRRRGPRVTYRPNDLDDQGSTSSGLTAYAVSGIETDQYVGGASIIDDDPTPG